MKQYKKLGQGSAALMAPPRGRDVSDVFTIVIPPITVVHTATDDTWTAKVSLHLGVFNSSGMFTLPMNANTIYRGQVCMHACNDCTLFYYLILLPRLKPLPFYYPFHLQADPTTIFKRMAMKVLGEMCCREFPLSSRFKRLLGPEYASDAGEATEPESAEEEEE